jgi:hypothetical protein
MECLCPEMELEAEELAERDADEVVAPDVNVCDELLPPAADGDAREDGLGAREDQRHCARSPNLSYALGKMLDAQGSRPALPRHRLKSNMRRASHASQITKMQDAPLLRRVSPWLHTDASGCQMRDAL